MASAIKRTSVSAEAQKGPGLNPAYEDVCQSFVMDFWDIHLQFFCTVHKVLVCLSHNAKLCVNFWMVLNGLIKALKVCVLLKGVTFFCICLV